MKFGHWESLQRQFIISNLNLFHTCTLSSPIDFPEGRSLYSQQKRMGSQQFEISSVKSSFLSSMKAGKERKNIHNLLLFNSLNCYHLTIFSVRRNIICSHLSKLWVVEIEYATRTLFVGNT